MQRDLCFNSLGLADADLRADMEMFGMIKASHRPYAQLSGPAR